jgi:spermidine/putrescine transport system ATP-binding protein
VPRKEIHTKVRRMLDLVHLTGRESARPRELSGGQQQRVALARALVLEPALVLFDEPLGALDLKLRRTMQALLREVQRETQMTFVYVTHDQEEAFSMSTRVGVMNAGVLEQVGSPREVYRRPATAFVAEFVGASNRFPGKVVSQEGARYVVELEALKDQVHVDGPPGIQNGTAVDVVVRPEAIGLGRLENSEHVAEGVVSDVSYTGAHTALVVDTELGPVDVAAAGDGDHDVSIGDRLAVSWRTSACWLVPRGAPVEHDLEFIEETELARSR